MAHASDIMLHERVMKDCLIMRTAKALIMHKLKVNMLKNNGDEMSVWANHLQPKNVSKKGHSWMFARLFSGHSAM